MQKYKMPIRLRIMVCLIGMLLPMCMFAQQITVQGVVKDQTGETVIGASVVQKNTTNGTITGIDGDFSLNVPSDAVIVVSFVGYKSLEVPVKGQKQIMVTLSEDSEMLDEVVVIGYGTMKKSDLTGAVSSLGSKDIKNAPVSNLGQAIQGRISGVQVVDAGKPGDNVSIKIRGLGSINNCDPLVVIDGVPTDLGLSSLNMADVERLDVLKDASATAIYGSRGANGVVMITTKRGTEGKGKLSVSANCAFQNATNVPSLLNASQYADLNNDGTIDDYDKSAIGKPNLPSTTLGWSFGGYWRGFSFNVLFQGSFDYSFAINGTGIESFKSQFQPIHTSRWTLERYQNGEEIGFPRLTTNPSTINSASTYMSDFWLINAWYIRLKTVDLGYQLPKKILPKAIDNIRFYVNAYNLLTFTGYDKYQQDPEIKTNTAGDAYMNQRVVNLGVQLTF